MPARPDAPVAAPWIRLLSALPDAATACGCAVAWVSPFTFGPDAVRTVLLMMLVEFILLHATGFFAGALEASGSGGRHVLVVLALSSAYLVFVGAFALIFHSWWPLVAYGWLVVGKIAWSLAGPRGSDGETERQRQMGAWAFSLVAYLGAVFAALLLPLPELGLDAATLPRLHLPGSGAWVEHPVMVVGAAVIYYASLAGFKAWGGRWNVQPAGDP